MEEFVWFEICLWVVLFILLLLVLRAVLKGFCPNRAIFRSGNDVKRKRRDEEEDEEEEEEDEEMMKPDQATINGQSSEPLTATAPSLPRNGTAATSATIAQIEESEWEIQTTAATKNAPPRPSRPSPPKGLEARRPGVVSGDENGVAGADGGATTADGDGGNSRRRRLCGFESSSLVPSRRKTLEALVLTLLTILLAYFAMLGVFAFVYYLFESDFLYGNAIPCPASATDDCQLNDEEILCCDYSFDVDGLEREDQYVGVKLAAAPAAAAAAAAAAFDDARQQRQERRISARVHLWFVSAHVGGEFYDAKRPKYLVYTHGNINNLSFDKKLYEFLAKDLGFNVVAWDYPGFGKSTGTPSEDTLHASMEAVLQWLVDYKNARMNDIALWGYSLGGTVTVKAANRFSGIMGVILQAPIDSSLSVVRSTLPLSGWSYIGAITQKFDSGVELDKLQSCLFLFVGEKDDTMSPRRMRKLYDRAQETNPSCRKFAAIPSLGHLSNPLDSPLFIRELRLFLNKIINMSN